MARKNAQWMSQAAGIVWCGQVLIAALLLSARVNQSSGNGSLAAWLAVAVLVWTTGVWAAITDARRRRRQRRPYPQSATAAASVCPTLVMLAVPQPATQAGLLFAWGCWSLLTMLLVWSGDTAFHAAQDVDSDVGSQPANPEIAVAGSIPVSKEPVRDLSAEPAESAEHSADESELAFPDDCVQTVSRSKAADGEESIAGSVRLSFADGQKLLYWHVPFAPAFADPPSLWCECDTDQVRVKAAAVHSYGVRFELRRSSGESAAAVELSYVARSAASARRAA